MLQDRKEQNRLDDWKEFQFREYKKADGFIKDMENAAKDKKVSEGRLHAAIAAGKSANEKQSMKEHGVIVHEARRGTAEIKLKRQNMYLKWIDEQLPIISYECQASGMRSETRNHHQSS